MSVRIKFCGLTRSEDVAAAETLGAAYIGAIFAGGPRQQTPESAAILFQTRAAAQRVGVWGALTAPSGTNRDVGTADHALRATVAAVPLDVIQLHADTTVADVERARALFQGTGAATAAPAVWSVIRVSADRPIPEESLRLFDVADAVVLDTRVSSQLGGTGLAFDWNAVAEQIALYRRSATRPHAAMLVVAGGLTPENVADATRILRPDVVDVSSGVESAPGIKDHDRMRSFVQAVRQNEHGRL